MPPEKRSSNQALAGITVDMGDDISVELGMKFKL